METRRLYRSTTNKVLCGVCGGIGEYFHIDPVLVRLVWVVLMLFRPGRHLMHSMFGFSVLGASIVLYLLAVVVIPKNPGC